MNNLFGDYNCPAFMDSDGGRLITDYKHSKYTNFNIMKMNNLSNNNQLREYLQNNGKEMMDIENKLLEEKKCKNKNNVNFYLDSSKYDNNYFKNN